MSALPPKADIVQHDRDVCFVPKADIRSPVGGGDQRTADCGLRGMVKLERCNLGRNRLVAALRSSPHQKGRYLTVLYLGGPVGRPFCYWELFATIPLTNDESVSSPF